MTRILRARPQTFWMVALTAFVLSWAATAVLAQAPAVTIPVMTGSKTGSYYKFVNQASNICSEVARLEVRESSGSVANFTAAENNETALWVGQMDIADLNKRIRDMSNVKLLFPLFPEQLHFVTRSDVTRLDGQKTIAGFAIPGTGTQVQLKNVADLVDKNVVAAGGSFKTGQNVAYVAGLRMNLRQVDTADIAIQEVLAGRADAAILVGAQPLGTITGMGARQTSLRLLPIPEEMMTKVAAHYAKSQPLIYGGMGEGGNNIQTVQVMAGLFTQNYPKSKIGDAIYAFQQCLLREAADQATIPGNHPAWRNLRMTAGLNWDLWNYQGATQATAPVPAGGKGKK